MDEVDDFLAHYGVKGMRWGVRKSSTPGVHPKVDRDASKDAKEFARAKLFYGTGAGTRRKLIKAKVEEKSKNTPGYKKAFDNHLSKQDMSKHSEKAVSERKRTDRKTKNKQRRGAAARQITGEMGTQAAFVALAAGGAAFVMSPRGAQVRTKAVSTLKNANEARLRAQGASKLKDYL